MLAQRIGRCQGSSAVGVSPTGAMPMSNPSGPLRLAESWSNPFPRITTISVSQAASERGAARREVTAS